MTLGIGIVGAGVMGADHARIVGREVAGARLVAVADPTRTRGAQRRRPRRAGRCGI